MHFQAYNMSSLPWEYFCQWFTSLIRDDYDHDAAEIRIQSIDKLVISNELTATFRFLKQKLGLFFITIFLAKATNGNVKNLWLQYKRLAKVTRCSQDLLVFDELSCAL